MKNNTIVVYMDASFFNSEFELKKLFNVGLGVYMIDSEGNDLKIGKGFSTRKIINATYAEIASLNLFINHVKDNINYKDKDFIIYSDCEDVINILNGKYNNKKTLKLKDHFIESLKEINLKSAYWVKGHSKQKGNLIVDTLAYNSLRENKDNNEADYESISNNKHLAEIFKEVKRCPKNIILTSSNSDLNKESYNIIFDEENNATSKKDSINYKKYKDRLDLIQDGDDYIIKIGYNNDSYYANNETFDTFNKVAEHIIKTQSQLQEFTKSGTIKIHIENKDVYENFYPLYNEINDTNKKLRELKELKELKNEYKKNESIIGSLLLKQKEFSNKSDLHSGVFKIARNKKIIINEIRMQKYKIKP